MQNDPILQPFLLGTQEVPGYWRFLLPEAVKLMRPPLERRSTCANCPMIAARGFRPDYRCCTYLPLVPGFALGLAMREGQARPLLERLIHQGHMTPEGLHPSPFARFHFKRQDALGLYGKGETLCHLLEPTTGRCSIYAFRNGVCSTFFCINDHGALGEQFWAILRDMVCHLETGLQQWALQQIGFDLEHYMLTLDSLADAPLDASDTSTHAWRPQVLDQLWGSWRGREIELFLALGEIISKNRNSLARIASKQKILEPIKFESALSRLCQDDVFAETSEWTESGRSEIKALVSLLCETEATLWQVPDLEYKIRLHPSTELDLKLNYVRFYEDDDYWELNLTKLELEALSFFLTPLPLKIALDTSPALKQMSDPRSFIAEYLANQILIVI